MEGNDIEGAGGGGGERDSLVPLLDECGGTVPLSSFEVR